MADEHSSVAEPATDPRTDGDAASPFLGPNAWLVEEMYEQYRSDPGSVSENWRDFFEDYRSSRPQPVTAARLPRPLPPRLRRPLRPRPPRRRRRPPRSPPRAPPAAAATSDAAPVGKPILGAGALIVANMERSLGVPTATSFRDVPAKLLEVNRKIINGFLGRSGAGKISFTHLIAYAVVRTIADDMPVMSATFAEDAEGKPRVVHHDHVNVGIAVDMEKSDGTPHARRPRHQAGRHPRLRRLPQRLRGPRPSGQDRQAPGHRLPGRHHHDHQPGHHRHRPVGAPPDAGPGRDRRRRHASTTRPSGRAPTSGRSSELAVSKVVTLTSTYDHRIIQGAESGMFLKAVHERLMGEHGFYHDVFRSLGVPYEEVKWRRDVSPLDREEALLHKQMQVATLIRAYRARGHRIADLDPLDWKEPAMPDELDPATYGLTIWDLDREFLTGGVAGKDRMHLGDLLGVLRDAYCRSIGIEYMHIQDTDEQRWIQSKVEGIKVQLSSDELRHLLERLNAAEALERFLATKYVGTKRFGLEGAESAIPILDKVLSAAADSGLDGSVIGMAHRGRLNVLANIVGKSYDQIFREFEGYVDPTSVQGSGDVKYHLGAVGKYVSPSGADIKVELAANPSHLETVDPIVLGMVRAKQDQIDPPGSYPWLSVLIHGDAAFAGQGVVAECLAMSDIVGYRVGGTIHLIINNQIGFTTSPQFARSSPYCTDMAKMLQSPIFHVNGDDPEACVRVAALAFEYRQRFHKDVVIDMVCYRRQGHNEGDDPSYTQPLMYKAIGERRSVRKLFVEALVKRGELTLDEAEETLADFHRRLQVALDETRQSAPAPTRAAKPPAPQGVLPHVVTGVDRAVLDEVFDHLTAYPPGFTPHPKLVKQFETRAKLYHEGGEVEWATAEALAFGSLVLEGTDIRLAGEDSRRGTFSQRHATLIDYETERAWTPLNDLPGATGKFRVYDSLLSEYAAVGYEYGYSVANKDALVLWEAQFGDFVNGAQIIIDQYLVAAEDKWGQTSGLVLLLPHGFEGQGPEHSSARIERFLTLAAEDNIQVCNATTAAQYFHLLRRQIRRDVRKPLVQFTPKRPLRMKETRSPIEDLTHGSFQEVLDDPSITDPAAVRRLIFCSGKVAYDAIAERDKRQAPVASSGSSSSSRTRRSR